jgi:hypothetical protein
MRSHATKTMVAEPVRQPEENNLRALPYTSIFLFETADDFASISANTFSRRLPGNSVVICKCADQTRTVILNFQAQVATIY